MGLLAACTVVRLGIAQGGSVSNLGCYPMDPAPEVSDVLAVGIPSGVILAEALDDNETAIDVSDATLFRAGMEFLIEDELFKVISKSSNTLTVATRGYGSTTPAAHADMTAITVTPFVAGQTSPFGSVLPAHGGDGIVEVGAFTHGTVTFPAAWTAADLAFLTATSRHGTFVDYEDTAGDRIKITGITTNASTERPLPDDLFRTGYFKLESIDTADEGAEVQAADRVILITLKV